MSRIYKSSKMTWIHQLCSLETNYKSHGIWKLWGVVRPNLNFWGVRTPTTPAVVRHCKPIYTTRFIARCIESGEVCGEIVMAAVFLCDARVVTWRFISSITTPVAVGVVCGRHRQPSSLGFGLARIARRKQLRSRRRKSVACNYAPDDSVAPSSFDWLHYIAAAVGRHQFRLRRRNMYFLYATMKCRYYSHSLPL